jgi:hypothetical protein
MARSHANNFRLHVNDPIYQATFAAMRLARDTDREIMTTKARRPSQHGYDFHVKMGYPDNFGTSLSSRSALYSRGRPNIRD